MSEMTRIGFIGAGGVNFGGAEGPWDHASRLERIEGVTVVGVADPDADKAEKALAARRAGPAGKMYAGARVFPDVRALLGQARPEAVFIGVPPAAHGRTRRPADIELVCAAAGVHMFIEKPLGCLPPADMRPVVQALRGAAGKGLVVSVGYMFRYGQAVAAMARILAQTPGGPRAVVARYDCAYSQIAKAEWWDIRRSGGPIVEQATHFCDLARLLAGEPDPASVRATSIPFDSPAAGLADMPVGPGGVPVGQKVPRRYRIPRATAAAWRFRSGAIGSLTHGVLLHGKKYEAELEVWGDGLRMVLQDPYGQCRLCVRRPKGEQTEVLDFSGDDPYFTEDAAFIQAVRARDPSGIRSTYQDAMRTYEFTWAIRRAAERAAAR